MNAIKDKYYTCKYDRAFKEVIVTEEATEIFQYIMLKKKENLKEKKRGKKKLLWKWYEKGLISK